MTTFIASQAHKGHSKLVNASRSPQHALWSACQLGADDETIFRLSETADLNAPCRKMNNFTALHFAAERGQQNVVEVLIALRANTLAQTSALEGEEYGLTPRDLAAAHGHPQAIK
jgi:ankyrin repeat protein